jgi:hypothetical protein
LAGTSKPAPHHLCQEHVRLVQAENLLPDKAVENAEGTRDLDTEGTAEHPRLPVIREHEEPARAGYRNASSFSGIQSPSDLVRSFLLSVRQIDELQPGPVTISSGVPACGGNIGLGVFDGAEASTEGNPQPLEAALKLETGEIEQLGSLPEADFLVQIVAEHPRLKKIALIAFASRAKSESPQEPEVESI